MLPACSLTDDDDCAGECAAVRCPPQAADGNRNALLVAVRAGHLPGDASVIIIMGCCVTGEVFVHTGDACFNGKVQADVESAVGRVFASLSGRGLQPHLAKVVVDNTSCPSFLSNMPDRSQALKKLLTAVGQHAMCAVSFAADSAAAVRCGVVGRGRSAYD